MAQLLLPVFPFIYFLETTVFSLCSCVYLFYLFIYSGGFAAVIYTDSIQTLIIVGGAFSLMFIGGAGHSNTTIPNILFFKLFSNLTRYNVSLCLLQPSPGLDGMRDWLSSTWAPLPLLQSQTRHVTSLEAMPSICSGTRWLEICHGQVWCLVSPYWQHGSGAQIRWFSIFTAAQTKAMCAPDWQGSSFGFHCYHYFLLLLLLLHW